MKTISEYVLGDMLELGHNTMQMHYEVGRYAEQKGVDLVLTSGVCAKEMARGAGSHGRHFESREALIAALPSILRKGDCVLVKASHFMGFDRIVHIGEDEYGRFSTSYHELKEVGNDKRSL